MAENIYFNCDINQSKRKEYIVDWMVNVDNRFNMNYTFVDFYDEFVNKVINIPDKFIQHYLLSSQIYNYRLIAKESDDVYVTYNFQLINEIYKSRNKDVYCVSDIDSKTKDIYRKNVRKVKIETLLGDFEGYMCNNDLLLYASDEQMNSNKMLTCIKNTIKLNMTKYSFKHKRQFPKRKNRKLSQNKYQKILQKIRERLTYPIW